MVGPSHMRTVWHHKANKADDTADGHRGGHQQGAAQQQEPLHNGHLHPEVVRLFLAKLQQVEGTSRAR